jgi:guanylate kinase
LSAEPLLVVIIGPGGVGKGSVVKDLVARDSRLWLSKSWTTRTKRPSESGDEYVFVTPEAFREAIAADAFLEWAEFQGHLYGTPRPSLEATHDLLLEIEIQGAQHVRQKNPEAVIILLTAPSKSVLEERLRSRGDDEEHVQRRLTSSEYELDIGRQLADFVVVNEEVSTTVAEISSILEGLRQSRRSIS